MRIRRSTALAAGLAAACSLRAGAAPIELDAPVAPASFRQPEPAAVAQQEAAKRIRELYKAEYLKRVPADQLALAKKLIQDGLATPDDPAARYVFLREGRDLAAQAGDAATAMAAVDHLAKLYTVDAPALKAAALAAAEKAVRTPEAASVLAEARLALADEAFAADQFDAAAAHAAKAETAAKHAADASLAARAQARAKDIAEARREAPLAQAAEKTIAEKPDDPAANLTAGRYWCLVKDAWPKGLPMLAKGSDPALKAAAEKDVAKPSAAADQVAAGDAWWEAAEKASGLAKPRLTARALSWYQQAWPTLPALGKTRLRERARAALASRGVPLDPKAYKPPSEPPLGWEIPPDRQLAHLDERYVHTGRYSIFLTAPPESAIRIITPPSAATAGQRFTFSAWVRTENTVFEKDYLLIRFAEANGDSVDSYEVCPVADMPFWHHLQRTVPCPKGAVRVQLAFRAGSPGGQIWLDDASLKREGDGVELLENGSFERK
jgi:hypothetical protein